MLLVARELSWMIKNVIKKQYPKIYIFFTCRPLCCVAMLGELSSKSLGIWAGLGTAAFLGYCIYFDRWDNAYNAYCIVY